MINLVGTTEECQECGRSGDLVRFDGHPRRGMFAYLCEPCIAAAWRLINHPDRFAQALPEEETEG